MKNIIFILTLLFTMSPIVHADNHIYTEEGYPYKNLIKKADQVALKYWLNEGSLHCQVTIVNQNNRYSAQIQSAVSKKRFSEAPMAACLNRAEAKSFLKQL